MNYCNNSIIEISSDVAPCVCARTILPITPQEEIEDIKHNPYLNKRNITYFIRYKGELYTIFIRKGYVWDGATIPFGFRWILGGKGNPAFLVASCVHDKICENKHLVDYNRKLSSIIFRELLLACGCPRLKAKIMYMAVNNYQSLIKGWQK